jgi:drug/metabolite transporter (DMT)-like permease
MRQLLTARTTLSGETLNGATLQGLAAIVLWSSLAAITSGLSHIPPFELAALSFAIATVVGIAYAAVTGTTIVGLRSVPRSYWLLGVYGLLGYHAAYFYAFQHAPAVEANLINYLWPLLIVLFSALLPLTAGGRPLQPLQIGGTLLAFAGTAILLSKGTTPNGAGTPAGYLAAFAAAAIWSSYSVALRMFAAVPSSAVTICCALTACGAALLHLTFERTVMPGTTWEWAAIAAQGLGPVGLAFFLWDAAMKRGRMRLLGIAAYATPLLSTLLLASTGRAELTPTLLLSAVLVTLGAVFAAQGSGQRKDANERPSG